MAFAMIVEGAELQKLFSLLVAVTFAGGFFGAVTSRLLESFVDDAFRFLAMRRVRKAALAGLPVVGDA